MLYWVGQQFESLWGPMRLLQSHLVLCTLGAMFAAVGSFIVLRRWAGTLPLDRGREHAAQATEAIGKPTGAGALFIPVTVLVALLVSPWDPFRAVILLCVLLAMGAGYLDDRSPNSWGRVRKGLIDLAISMVVAWAMIGGESSMEIWLPFFAPKMGPEALLDGTTGMLAPILWQPWQYGLMATLLLWFSINTTNCSDGVDGLSGSLLSLALLGLGGVLYGVVGHIDSAHYLLVPFYEDGASWAVVVATTLGTLAAYLWFNAHPSQLMMGDAGSRALGLLLGVFVLATGNPFLLLVVALLILANGGIGLFKIGFIKYLKIDLLKSVRCPLHDHFLKNCGWSSTQVLVRFVILQAVLAPLLIVILLKVR
ncbi:MAG: phospho-N-acetylmuramoyl-pentapeptide-transferase [Planctomycetes bacterium]|nr:phospho-N-acetylmuramoyl-pentapeptide-transferase [Planctomycetota bacterium]MBT6784077.1 phospho-N-acetylmuramoyl-pentapeptide-transferase [Planctomycetota bacterium]MBT7104704.1 phospho-N-acetylmuramoyl-pentapeptide-transferase [Planctomycetota bacterium]MBT7131420.1 phospho-N-acetylmuramoyl-pentapeptide-transferase [Planctomycetota bacterium]